MSSAKWRQFWTHKFVHRGWEVMKVTHKQTCSITHVACTWYSSLFETKRHHAPRFLQIGCTYVVWYWSFLLELFGVTSPTLKNISSKETFPCSCGGVVVFPALSAVLDDTAWVWHALSLFHFQVINKLHESTNNCYHNPNKQALSKSNGL